LEDSPKAVAEFVYSDDRLDKVRRLFNFLNSFILNNKQMTTDNYYNWSLDSSWGTAWGFYRVSVLFLSILYTISC